MIIGEFFGDGEAVRDLGLDVKVLAASTYSDSTPSSLDAKVSDPLLMIHQFFVILNVLV